ncbi:MAG: NAD(P)/FAD-dependent oxidoreductase [Sphingomonas sp.]|nr:NAD(P)/FAD-dependent oxidoreductase [Sphingomonas sp.]
MEAKRVPGVYAVGESVDVTNWLDKYNFQRDRVSGSASGVAADFFFIAADAAT